MLRTSCSALLCSLSSFGPIKRIQTTLGNITGHLGLSMALSSSHPPLLHTPLGALPLPCGVTGIWRTTSKPGTDTSIIRHQTEVSTCFLLGVADSPLCLSEDRQSARLTARAPAPRHSWPSSLITPPQEPHGGLTRSRIREGGWENKTAGIPTRLTKMAFPQMPFVILLTSGITIYSLCTKLLPNRTLTKS